MAGLHAPPVYPSLPPTQVYLIPLSTHMPTWPHPHARPGSTGLCRSVLSMSCISTFTAIGCFLAAMNNYTAPADVLTSASEGGGGGGSVYGATPADGGSGGGSGDSGDGADTVLLAGLLGGTCAASRECMHSESYLRVFGDPVAQGAL